MKRKIIILIGSVDSIVHFKVHISRCTKLNKKNPAGISTKDIFLSLIKTF
jgi:hypothetical protein